MQFATQVLSLLPFLRRYARALSGSSAAGDELVAATIDRLRLPNQAPDTADAKVELYRQFNAVWRSMSEGGSSAQRQQILSNEKDGAILSLESLPRQAFLLTALEQFEKTQAARVLGVAPAELEQLLEQARQQISRQVRTDVLIIEDEMMIALELQRLIEGLGHRVCKIARTRAEAVVAASKTQPGLVLADVQLADSSSGLDAAADLLMTISVPIIFITAYPERVLTGTAIEPTFVISKPFNRDNVRAAVSQALFFRDHAALKTGQAAGNP